MKRFALLACSISALHAGDLHTPLVYDTPEPTTLLPKRHRSLHALPTNFCARYTCTGIEKLHATGSGQFTAQQLARIINALGLQPTPLILIDLREEYHAFIADTEGTALSWYGLNSNQSNKGMTTPVIMHEEKRKIQHLAKEYSPDIHVMQKIKNPDAKSSIRALSPACPLYTPLPLFSEEALAHALGISYHRITITDRSVPTDSAIDALIELFETAPPNAWFIIHCRGGSGRTTFCLILYDIVMNAHQVHFEAIVTRQCALAFNACNSKYQDRLHLLKKIYGYIREKRKGCIKSWSVWHATHSPKNVCKKT